MREASRASMPWKLQGRCARLSASWGMLAVAEGQTEAENTLGETHKVLPPCPAICLGISIRTAYMGTYRYDNFSALGQGHQPSNALR